MSAIILDGAALAERIRAEVAERVAELAQLGVNAGLATVLVGDDLPSARYVELKHQDCAEVGMASFHRQLPADASQAEVLAVVAELNANEEVDAYLVQYPLPPSLDYDEVLLAVDAHKDADGMHPVNLGRLVAGAAGPLPCTPNGILELLSAYDVPVEGKHVVIVGRGLTIGRPLANLLALKRPRCNAAVTVVHTGVADIGSYTRQADVLVAAAGAPGLITPDMVKPGAAVVGAGVRKEGKRLMPDVVDEVAEVAGWFSPRVGGVGPMTRAMLLRNAVEAAARRAGR